jgi:hypothetical protein
MHNLEGEGETQIVFAVEGDCFAGGEGPDPAPVTIGTLVGLIVEPYHAPDPAIVHFGGIDSPTTAAYALAVGDRMLCVYLSWDPVATPAKLDAARAVINSIRAEPFGRAGIRIVFSTQGGWDTG